MSNYEKLWKSIGIATAGNDDTAAITQHLTAQPQPLHLPNPRELKALRVEAGMSPEPEPPAKSGADAREKAIQQAVSRLDPAMDQHGGLILRIREPNGKLTIIDAQSSAAEELLALHAYEATGKSVSTDTIRRHLGVVRARARQSAELVRVRNRTAPLGDGYVIDRGDSTGACWHVRPARVEVVRNGDTAFRRGQGYGEHPPAVIPETAYEALECVRGWLAQAWGLPDDDTTAVALLLVEWQRSDTPQPVLELTGGAGAGKTTFAQQLAALVDPRTAGAASTRLNREDIAAAVANSYVLYVDNISTLKADEQDLACLIATGATISARRLYTQGEVFLLEVLNPLIVTTIIPALTRADARTRVLAVQMPNRTGQLSPATLNREFEARRVELVGALMRLLADGLERLPQAETARTYTHRLASFEMLSEAVLSAAAAQAPNPEPYRWGTAGDIFRRKRKASAEEASQDVPTVGAVLQLIDEARQSNPETRVDPPSRKAWLPAKRYAYVDQQGVLHVGALLPVLLAKVPQTLNGTHGAVSTERALKLALQLWEHTLSDIGIRMSVVKTAGGVCVEFQTSI